MSNAVGRAALGQVGPFNHTLRYQRYSRSFCAITPVILTPEELAEELSRPVPSSLGLTPCTMFFIFGV